MQLYVILLRCVYFKAKNYISSERLRMQTKSTDTNEKYVLFISKTSDCSTFNLTWARGCELFETKFVSPSDLLAKFNETLHKSSLVKGDVKGEAWILKKVHENLRQ